MALDGTELCEAITAVREGLTAAQQGGDGSPIRFTVKEITTRTTRSECAAHGSCRSA
ncbi:trypco2 family protein [Streptomyces sp. NPDC055037]